MHLKQLKLAGFKSFVEPTVIPFPSQLVAVVGPNGCGKSNIIDAVRWVMGESSAKNLRGTSMTDVIFNGSSSRKSVGQASVELVFDNSSGRLTGQYASYQELSIKRLLTRDGESSYYLNGSRCRRRDINDVFLGTGAGARGYSIIGQDMISRLVEARPDDLRSYLEEAAGVSKYKERRRETAQRISHTRENLERVADIRGELDKQLSRLERQAKAAMRYKALKQSERLYKAEIIALKWRSIVSEHAAIQAELLTLSLQYEHHQANISALLREVELLGKQNLDVTDELQFTQTQFYQLGTEIARLEESIQQHSREKKRLELDQQQVHADRQMAMTQLQQDVEQMQVCEQTLQGLNAQLQTLQERYSNQQLTLNDNQQQEITWNQQWQILQGKKNQVKRELDSAQIRLEHLEKRRQETQVRLEKIVHEQALIQVETLQNELTKLQIERNRLINEQEIAEKNYQEAVETGSILRQHLCEIELLLRKSQDQLQSLSTEHAVLSAAQQAALHVGKDIADCADWKNKARMVEAMTVHEKWQPACELVLGEGLQAVLMDSIDDIVLNLPSMQGCSLTLVIPFTEKCSPSSFPRLIDKIQGIKPCWIHALEHVFAAENLEEALSWLPKLNPEQSIVTVDGYWLGIGWAKIASTKQPGQEGLLSRQQSLVKLAEALSLAQHELRSVQGMRDQLHLKISENADEAEALKNSLFISQDANRRYEALISNKQLAVDNAQARSATLAEERESLHSLLETLLEEYVQEEKQVKSATEKCTQQEQQETKLMHMKMAWSDALIAGKQEVETTRTALHQAELQQDREKSKNQQFRANIKREQARVDTLNGRFEQLGIQLSELNEPSKRQQQDLESKVLHYQHLEKSLSAGRGRSNALQAKLKCTNDASYEEKRRAKNVEETIQQQQLQAQAHATRANTYVEALSEINAHPETLLASIPTEMTLQKREKNLLDVDEKIKRLGAINLVAIEEYETERLRKQYLDDQHQDLTDALAMLDTAIAKMDKETILRLKDTFDQINISFQSLFPRLFGGGRALLELTCDNLLEAGILVMAQPPGKRNSTIHMLSGGEKAMTAVALIFAIFQLNPSPFCMLDEVDAPLDEVNVKRFCELVKEMSPYVQFLFITHNKVTMELADHLIGVTMHEPGVSRIVSVDVEQALYSAR